MGAIGRGPNPRTFGGRSRPAVGANIIASGTAIERRPWQRLECTANKGELVGSQINSCPMADSIRKTGAFYGIVSGANPIGSQIRDD